METDAVKLVKHSFDQCCARPEFFDDFYEIFFSSSAEIKKMFDDTDLDKHRVLLSAGISDLIMSYQGDPGSNARLTTIGTMHSREELNVRPFLYPLWVNSLIATIAKYDPDYSDKLKKAWVQVLGRGVKKVTDQFY